MMRELSNSAKADLELVNAIKSEDKRTSDKAFTALFKKYHDSMLFHFRGLSKNEEDAKELILAAFEKASRNLEKFNEETAVFSTWLFKLTQNLFIDRLRKKKADLVSLTDLATSDSESNIVEYSIVDKDGNPETKTIIKERNKKISDIIDAMDNAELSEVVKLRYFDNMSYDEIVSATGKPLGTVKAFIFRAKQILKVEFEKANII